MYKFIYWLKLHYDIYKLNNKGHFPYLNPWVLAKYTKKYILSEKIHLADTIIFPGCGCGSNELAFISMINKTHKYKNIIFMDRLIISNDIKIWKKHMQDTNLIILNNYNSLYHYLQNYPNDSFNMLWFNRHHIKFLNNENDLNSFISILKICINKCSNPYINAFQQNNNNNIYSSSWYDLLNLII